MIQETNRCPYIYYTDEQGRLGGDQARCSLPEKRFKPLCIFDGNNSTCLLAQKKSKMVLKHHL